MMYYPVVYCKALIIWVSDGHLLWDLITCHELEATLNGSLTILELFSYFKPGIHCSSIAAKAYSRCSLLLKGFHTSDVSILLPVFKTYVRPLLEFNTPVWNPWLFKDIEHIEGVQRYFTRKIYKRARLPHMDYASRLANLHLSSLEYRRVYFDLTMCYKL